MEPGGGADLCPISHDRIYVAANVPREYFIRIMKFCSFTILDICLNISQYSDTNVAVTIRNLIVKYTALLEILKNTIGFLILNKYWFCMFFRITLKTNKNIINCNIARALNLNYYKEYSNRHFTVINT